MDDEFVKQVRDVLNFIYQREYIKLGNSKLASFRPIQKDIPPGSSPLEGGHRLSNIVENIFLQNKSDFEKKDLESLVKLHIFSHKSIQITCGEMGVAEATFHNLKNETVEIFANLIWSMEPLPINNLRRPPYVKFIPRKTEEGKDYVEWILQTLEESRAWNVAIYGFGGVGKTVLAYEVAAKCVARKLFEAIVWISAKKYYLSQRGQLPLDGYVSTIDDILDDIADTLGELKVRKLGHREKMTEIKELLSTKKCLIIFDNLESLSKQEHDAIQRFLEDQLPPPSKALLTSRHREILGEKIITLPPMSHDEAMEFMKVQWQDKIERNIDIEALRKIFEYSSGVPLAMQFLVGQIAIHGNMQIDLSIPLDLETKDNESAPTDQLLRFILEDSYNRLHADGKKILQTLTIFPESASVDSIRIASGIASATVNAELKRLNILSIVNVTDERFSILEPTKAFLREVVADDRIYIREAYLRLAEHYIEYSQRDLREILRFLNREKENILYVMEWCYSEQKWLQLVGLVDLIGNGLELWGYWAERIKWGERAVEACQALGDWEKMDWHRVYDIGWMYLCRGDIENAERIIEAAFNSARQQQNQVATALALRNLGVIASKKGDFDKAERLLNEALGIFENLNLPRWIASTKGAIGNLAASNKKYEIARIYLEEALQIKVNIDEIPGITGNLSDLASLYIEMAMFEDAKRCLDRSMTLAIQYEMIEEEAYAQARLSILEGKLGNYEKALEIGKQAFRVNERIGNFNEAYKIAVEASSYAEKLSDYKEASFLRESAQKIKEKNSLLS